MTRTLDPIEAVSQRLERFARVQAADAADWGDEAADFVALGARALEGGNRLRARF